MDGGRHVIYRAAEVEIDPALAALRRAGEPVHLRPKTFQVLLFLIQHRDRLVTKDELIDSLWPGIAVTDDAIVQCIVDLRRALGDDPRRPQWIKTIPKAGYRFIGDVEILEPSGRGVIEIEEVTTIEAEFVESPETAAPVAGAERALPKGRSVVYMIVAIALLMAFAGAWWIWRGRSSAIDAALPRTPGKRSVAVLHFENQSGSKPLDWLREGLSDMLITELSRSRRLAVLSRPQLGVLLDRIGHAADRPISLDEGIEIARRSEAEVIIAGSFSQLGERIRVDLRCHDGRDGRMTFSDSLVVDRADQLLSQIDLLAHKLSDHLGASAAGARPGLASAMTSNLDAYRYYSLALEQVQMFQFHEAIALLEKALALDPQFAMAYARIGYVLAVRLGDGQRAKPYLEKSLSLADRLSDRDGLLISAWLANAERDIERTIRVYRELAARYPFEIEAYQRLAWALQSQNRNEEALEAVREGLVLDPESKDLHNALGSVYMRMKRFDDAVAAFKRYIHLAPNDPNALDSLAELYRWIGRHEEAEAAYNGALALNPESGVAVIHLGHLRFQQGRYREAAEQYRRYVQIARDDTGRARGYNCLAWLYMKKGDLRLAAGAIKEELRYNPTSLWNSLAMAFVLKDRAEVEKLSKRWFTPEMHDLHRERGYLRFWEYQRGYVALREGRGEEALAHFRAALAQRAVEWNIDSFEDCLAQAHLELGHYDEAIAEYERILQINSRYALAHYRLAQAYEGKGEANRAQEAYRRFLEVWRDADADIPEVIEARRKI